MKSSMDVARIRLRSTGYNVFNAVAMANINDSLFHIKMVEEWCGPLQWIDDCRRKSENETDEDSESGDSHGGGPLMENDWGNNFDAGWEEEGSQADEREAVVEEAGDTVYEEVSMVQETIGIFDDKQQNMNEPNDCSNGRNESKNGGAGNQKEVIEEVIVERLCVRTEFVGVACEVTHISNTEVSGGSKATILVGMETVEVTSVNDGLRIEGGCELDGHPLCNGNPIVIGGPEKTMQAGQENADNAEVEKQHVNIEGGGISNIGGTKRIEVQQRRKLSPFYQRSKSCNLY